MTSSTAAQPPSNGLVRKAIRFAKKLNWLSPVVALDCKPGTTFGRKIELSLAEINQGSGLMRLKLRNRDAAVVMSIDHYQEVLAMKSMLSELIEKAKEIEVSQGVDEYEELYLRLTSEQTREASDGLFAATPEDLRQSFKPGATETS